MTIYKVIAFSNDFKNSSVKPFWEVKNYKRLSSAQRFLEIQKNNEKYYFEIDVVNN
jgi:hypothetical protein